MDFTEREKWITITTIMKTAQSSKMLSREQRDQLFLHLHRTQSPSLTDSDVREIERNIMDLANDVQDKLIEQVSGMLGTQDKKQAFEEAEKLVGKDEADKIKQKLEEHNDKKLR